MKTKVCSVLLIGFLLAMGVQGAFAGRVVISNDEWPLSDSGLTKASDGKIFATNVADWFTGGDTGRFLVYSTNFGLTGDLLKGTMEQAGYTWEVNSQADFTTDSLMQYDAVFLAGNPADTDVLTAYVNNGGNVYLAGGTGWGYAFQEANRWNPFLASLGLLFDSTYNHRSNGIVDIQSSHPLFEGVSSLYQQGGSLISKTDSRDTSDLLVPFGEKGLFAAYQSRIFDTPSSSTVPIPTSVWLLGSGLLGLVGISRRKRISR